MPKNPFVIAVSGENNVAIRPPKSSPTSESAPRIRANQGRIVARKSVELLGRRGAFCQRFTSQSSMHVACLRALERVP